MEEENTTQQEEPQMDPRLTSEDESDTRSLHHPAHPVDEEPEDHIGELQEKDPWTEPAEPGWEPLTVDAPKEEPPAEELPQEGPTDE